MSIHRLLVARTPNIPVHVHNYSVSLLRNKCLVRINQEFVGVLIFVVDNMVYIGTVNNSNNT